MKTMTLMIAAVVTLVVATAQAGDRWSVSIGTGHCGSSYGGYYSSHGSYGFYYSSPTYYSAPTYCPPPVTYYSSPTIYYSSPPVVYYSTPYYVAPRPVYVVPNCPPSVTVTYGRPRRW